MESADWLRSRHRCWGAIFIPSPKIPFICSPSLKNNTLYHITEALPAHHLTCKHPSTTFSRLTFSRQQLHSFIMAKGAESFSDGESCAFCSASAALACAALLSFQITTSESPLQVLHRITSYMSHSRSPLEGSKFISLSPNTSQVEKLYSAYCWPLGKVAFGLCSHGEDMVIEL